MSIQEKQVQLIDEFSFFDDWMDKYNHIIDMGKDLPLIDPEKKTDENIIRGCQSRVWLDAQLMDGKVVFKADSDAIITKGIIALMVFVYSNETPEAILEADNHFIDAIGLKEHLSPTRANGLLAMVKQMKFFALAFSSKN
jgi:cysteine desulfuration protein SufE